MPMETASIAGLLRSLSLQNDSGTYPPERKAVGSIRAAGSSSRLSPRSESRSTEIRLEERASRGRTGPVVRDCAVGSPSAVHQGEIAVQRRDFWTVCTGNEVRGTTLTCKVRGRREPYESES